MYDYPGSNDRGQRSLCRWKCKGNWERDMTSKWLKVHLPSVIRDHCLWLLKIILASLTGVNRIWLRVVNHSVGQPRKSHESMNYPPETENTGTELSLNHWLQALPPSYMEIANADDTFAPVAVWFVCGHDLIISLPTPSPWPLRLIPVLCNSGLKYITTLSFIQMTLSCRDMISKWLEVFSIIDLHIRRSALCIPHLPGFIMYLVSGTRIAGVALDLLWPRATCRCYATYRNRL